MNIDTSRATDKRLKELYELELRRSKAGCEPPLVGSHPLNFIFPPDFQSWLDYYFQEIVERDLANGLLLEKHDLMPKSRADT